MSKRIHRDLRKKLSGKKRNSDRRVVITQTTPTAKRCATVSQRLSEGQTSSWNECTSTAHSRSDFDQNFTNRSSQQSFQATSRKRRLPHKEDKNHDRESKRSRKNDWKRQIAYRNERSIEGNGGEELFTPAVELEGSSKTIAVNKTVPVRNDSCVGTTNKTSSTFFDKGIAYNDRMNTNHEPKKLKLCETVERQRGQQIHCTPLKTGESISRSSNKQAHGGTTVPPTPLSYTCLKNLFELNSAEDTSSRLCEQARLLRFEALLQQKELRYNLMKMVIAVINKVCQARMPSQLNKILGILNATEFWYTLGIFIAELETKKECLTDPHLLLLIEHLCKIFTTSLENLPHLHSRIPFLQLQNAVNYFKENGKVPTDAIDRLLTDVRARCEQEKKKIREKSQSAKPPNDFRDLSVFPTTEDIFRGGKPFLRENIVKKPFSSVEQYLDIHFRLLKEDSLAGLRDGVRDLRSLSYRQQQYGQAAVDSLSKSSSSRQKKDIIVYDNVVINEQVSSNRRNVAKGMVFNVAFNSNHQSVQRINWTRSKRLLYNSLVCLISTDFTKVYFATVANRDPDMLKEGYVQLCFEGNQFYGDEILQEEYRMVESNSVYFVAYRHILERLQQINEETMPFQRHIVFCEHEIAKPAYLMKNLEEKKKTINLKSVAVQQTNELKDSHEVLKKVSPFDLRTWPDGDVLGLNGSQYRAFVSALQREFAVIQGPPGTGKTYLGLKIAHTLLANSDLWKDNEADLSCPILMLAYTNHALDSFLEGLSINREDIIRVGGRSSSDVLKECNIKVVRRQREDVRYRDGLKRPGRSRLREVEREMTDCQKSLNRYTDILSKSFKGILPAQELKNYMLGTGHRDYLSDNFTMLEFLDVGLKPPEQNVIRTKAEEGNSEEEFHGHELGGHFFVGDSNPVEEDEMSKSKNQVLICLAEETMTPEEILELLKRNETKPATEKLEATIFGDDLLCLSVHERWCLYLLWLTRLREDLRNKIRDWQRRHLELSDEYEELRNIVDLDILRDSRVVGMTTTWAAQNHKLVRQLRPRVVIIEEAAELFEAHIISCLTKYCQHLILIGDHQQLRPNPSVYKLSKEYSLDVSLLERMIEAGVPYNRLSVQHRMRPEISKIFRHIYDGLEDHTSVTEYENIKGVAKNLFFIDHDVRESVHDNVHSKVNQHEAELLVELCLYLLRQGYKSTQITILTTYTGQMFVVRDLVKEKKDEFPESPRVSSVDNFQGEENDIILLSLVRNNEEENIGFLKTKNRVCVALSRARKGLYIIGNRKMLTNQSPLWKDVLADLDENGCIGKSLPLVCSNHQTENLVSSAADFRKVVPNGGCLERCQHRLECGHACPQMCHPNGHDNFRCEKPCPRNVSGCDIPGHKCTNLCWQMCDSICQYPVDKVLNCGHTKTIACSHDAEIEKCKQQCEKTLLCGHRCQDRCSAPCTEQCMEIVKKTDLSCGHENTMACSATQKDCKVPCSTLLECEHPCAGKCGECIQGRVHVKCAKKCNRNLICSHQCKSSCTKDCPPCAEKCPRKCYHSKCDHQCGKICIPCNEPCGWECEHYKCTERCSDMCDRPRCNQPCNRKLTCGNASKPHFCRGLCGERCVCTICEKNNGEDVTTIIFGTEDEDDARFIWLKDCEHIFESTALDQMMDSNDESDEIKSKVCPLCRAPILKSRRYGNIVKRIHDDIDEIKRKVLANDIELQEKLMLVKKMADELRPQITMILENMGSTNVNNAWKRIDKFVSNCKPSPVYYRNIISLESEMRLLEYWIRVKKSFEEAVKRQDESRASASYIEFDSEMQHVLSRILVMPANTGVPVLAQLNLELQRMSLKRDVLVLKIDCTGLKCNLKKEDEEVLAEIQKTLRNKEIINEESVKKFKKEISDICSRYPQLSPLTEEEKIQIVRAVGLKQGHWFKCPNGHFYAIGECGGAMEEGRCPDCDAVIGGHGHHLTSDNQLAPEMDGARYPAWSDQANMRNYHIDD